MSPIERREFMKASSVAGIAGLAGCVGSLTGGDGGELKLGAIQPLSGFIARMGNVGKEAQDVWLNHVNKQGGVNVGGQTREVNLIVNDDELESEKTRSLAQKMATTDNVAGIIAMWSTSGALAAKSVVEENELPTTATAQTVQISEPGTYMMRIIPSTAGDPYPLLKGIVSQEDDIQNIGLLGREGNAGQDMKDFVRHWADNVDTSLGWEDLGTFPFGQDDFSSFISKASDMYDSDDIDALMIYITGGNAINFLRQSERNGLNDKMPILLMSATTDFTQLSEIGEGLKNVFMASSYRPLAFLDNPEVSDNLPSGSIETVEQYHSLGGPRDPIGYIHWIQAELMTAAISDAGSTEGPAIRDNLVGTTRQTMIGDIRLNDNGQARIPSMVIRFDPSSESLAIDSIEWSGTIPPITNIPPQVDL